jgi:hypothetical protein
VQGASFPVKEAIGYIDLLDSNSESAVAAKRPLRVVFFNVLYSAEDGRGKAGSLEYGVRSREWKTGERGSKGKANLRDGPDFSLLSKWRILASNK